MANYLDKWKTDFPETVNNQTRPKNGIDNSLAFNTDGFPQRITSDPVHAKLENDMAQQLFSNDQRLKDAIDSAGIKESNHEKDSNAHANGIAGNAGSATKLATARTIQTNLASTSAASFNGTTNIAPGVTGTLPVGNGGTGQTNLDNVTVGTSKKVHTIVSSGTVGELVKATMGNDDSFRIAVGGGSNNGYAEIATADDGTEPIYVRQYANGGVDKFITPTRTATLLDAGGNTSFPGKVTAPTFVGNLNGNADRATKATQDASGNVIANTYVRHYQSIGETDLNNLKLGGLYANPLNANATAERHYPEVNHAGSIFVINNGANGDDGCTQVYTTFDSHNSYKREYDVNSKTWSAWRRYAFEDSTVANAQKLSTARKINITGNATGSASFDGSSDISISITVNESKHAATATTANTATNAARATTADTLKSSTATETSTVARPVWLSWEGDNTKQTVSPNLTYTCSTKTLTAANFKGHLAGNADTATNASHATNADKANTASSVAWSGVTGKPGTYPPSAHNHDSAYPSVTGTRASGTWGINISGNAASATNADKVDGYHASDLLRILGGNRTPVITDIFDRAGTIDMSTMSAADKATHKANINKASNVTQNIWNNSTGIHAYGGDLNIAGYNNGALKLTQSYKNFDKILVVGTNDNGDQFISRLYNAWELAYIFSHSCRLVLLNDTENYWNLYGSVRTGTNTNYALSTETVWNCEHQNCGIIGIYGIKY